MKLVAVKEVIILGIQASQLLTEYYSLAVKWDNHGAEGLKNLLFDCVQCRALQHKR